MLYNATSAMKIPWSRRWMQAHGYPRLADHLTHTCAALRERGRGGLHRFAAPKLIENNKARDRRQDRRQGLDRDASPMQHTAGGDIYRKAVVLGEGACGILTDKRIATQACRAARPVVRRGQQRGDRSPANERGSVSRPYLRLPADGSTTAAGSFIMFRPRR
jgi:hypothetical protein